MQLLALGLPSLSSVGRLIAIYGCPGPARQYVHALRDLQPDVPSLMSSIYIKLVNLRAWLSSDSFGFADRRLPECRIFATSLQAYLCLQPRRARGRKRNLLDRSEEARVDGDGTRRLPGFSSNFSHLRLGPPHHLRAFELALHADGLNLSWPQRGTALNRLFLQLSSPSRQTISASITARLDPAPPGPLYPHHRLATMAPSYSTSSSSDPTQNEKKDAYKKEDLPTGVVQMRVDGRGEDDEAQVIEEVDGVFGAQGAEPGQVNYRRWVSTS